MKFREPEIQKYIWEHRDDFFSLIEVPEFETDPNKAPSKYEPWELLYYRMLQEYEESYRSLKGLEFFGCEVGLEKDGESTIRADLLGSLEGDNGLVVCELKVNRSPERQAYTELLAYANHVRAKLSPMGRRDIFYLLISPMEERIVREATINSLIYDRNRVLVLIPEVDETLDTLRFRLWIPPKEEFMIFTKTAFAFENIDVFKISWRGAKGKWSPTKKGKKPNNKMIHQLDKVSHYAAQIMEANGINGFVFCSQSFPEVRDKGYLENGIAICGINPFKSAKTRYLFENDCDLKIASDAPMEALEIENVFPSLKDKSGMSDFHWMSVGWSTCLDEIAFDVVAKVNMNLGDAHYERGYGDFTWGSYLYRSEEDVLCWNYDISLTGLFREIYDLKLERYYKAAKDYSDDERIALVESDELKWHCIDMLYSQNHMRDFIRNLIGYENIEENDPFDDVLI